MEPTTFCPDLPDTDNICHRSLCVLFRPSRGPLGTWRRRKGLGTYNTRRQSLCVLFRPDTGLSCTGLWRKDLHLPGTDNTRRRSLCAHIRLDTGPSCTGFWCSLHQPELDMRSSRHPSLCGLPHPSIDLSDSRPPCSLDTTPRIWALAALQGDSTF